MPDLENKEIDPELEIIEDDDNNDDGKIHEDEIERLKRENIKWRQRAKVNRDAEKKASEAQRQLEETKKTAETALKRVDDLTNVANRRLIEAELRSAANEMGLKKIEYARMGDMSQVKIDENGQVTGVREMLAGLKDSDPDLFKAVTSTNVNFNLDRSSVAKSEKSVLKLSDEEYQKSEREFLRGNF